MVRIHAGQPFDAPPERGLLMACGRQGTKITNPPPALGAANGPEQAKRAEGLHLRRYPTISSADKSLVAAPVGILGTLNSLVASALRLAPDIPKGTPIVYFLRLRSGRIYIGASLDMEQRMEAHGSGRACRTTFLNPPTEVLRVETFSDFPNARRREAQLKRWSQAKKLALITGNLAGLRELSRSRDA